MKAVNYSGINDTLYTAGREIGRGGEGAVYEVKEDASLVVKLYNEPIAKDKADKLLYMASVTDAELLKFAAWPIDVVKDGNRNICGFTMKKLVGFVPLHNLFSPMDRKKLFPDKGYNFLVHVAKNLATAFYKIHQHGIVIGDVNEANVLVNSSGLVCLIDCDSFQVKNGNQYYFCEVGIPRYTAPELLTLGSFDKVVRTVNTDSFSLATLIFQLLFLGRAPFTGINLTKEEIDEEKAIKTKEFAYSLQRANKKLLPAKNTLELKFLSPGIINSFHAAFEAAEKRPEPKQWITDLETFSKELILCPNSKLHYYPKSIGECPWCLFKEKAGIVYFLDDSYLKGVPELDNIEQFVNGFKFEKLEIKKLSETHNVTGLTAAPIDKKFRSSKNIKQITLGVIIAMTLIAWYLQSWLYIFGGIFLTLILNSISPPQRKLDAELMNRKKNLEALTASLKAIIKKHNSPTDLGRYNQSVSTLSALIKQFRHLPDEFIAVNKKIEERNYNIQYKLYLQQFLIKDYPIPTFGPAKKQLIYSNGIRNAADIFRINNIKIPGIGPKNIQILLDWQRSMGAGFTYVPDFNLINREITFATNEIYIKRRKLEIAIQAEYKTMLLLRSNIISAVSILERQYQEAAIKVAQAELDFNAFKSFMKL